MDAQKTINDLILEHGPYPVLEAVSTTLENEEGFEDVVEAIDDCLEESDENEESEESEDDED